MIRARSTDVSKHTGKTVEMFGWVNSRRDHGKLIFIDLRDRDGLTQVVFADPKLHEVADSLRPEFVVRIEGEVKKRPKGMENPKIPSGKIEVSAKKLDVLSASEPELPIPLHQKQENEADREVRMDWRWIDLRRPEKRLIFEVWTTIEKAFRDYWTSNGYIEIHSPKLMASPSESRAELFQVGYFGGKAYLAQSPQFYKQMAMAAGLEKVFEVGPVFRANPSFTSRHDTEFTSFDTEISYVESHEDVMKELERTIAAVITAVKKAHGEEIKKEYGRELVVPKIPFPRITMAEAKEILKKLKIKSDPNSDLSPEEERKLSEAIKKKTGHEFVFVTEYPVAVRPFYHMRSQNPKLTKSFDLLWNGIEITTGAQREHRYDVLKKQAEEKGLRVKELENYLNFFKYGIPPHGGYGLGPSRMLTRIFDIPNVKEVTYLYRGPNRLTP
jgi:nondiscriminating aspartyl-tRNA synthetase